MEEGRCLFELYILPKTHDCVCDTSRPLSLWHGPHHALHVRSSYPWTDISTLPSNGTGSPASFGSPSSSSCCDSICLANSARNCTGTSSVCLARTGQELALLSNRASRLATTYANMWEHQQLNISHRRLKCTLSRRESSSSSSSSSRNAYYTGLLSIWGINHAAWSIQRWLSGYVGHDTIRTRKLTAARLAHTVGKIRKRSTPRMFDLGRPVQASLV